MQRVRQAQNATKITMWALTDYVAETDNDMNLNNSCVLKNKLWKESLNSDRQ